MRKYLLIIILFISASDLNAQQIDSIAFHLYTDSLKKGTHNYINVDGLLSNGRWLPLTNKLVEFKSTGGQFSGNDLIIPADFSASHVTITVVLKNNPKKSIETTIWIKQLPDPELPVPSGTDNRGKRRNSG